MATLCSMKIPRWQQRTGSSPVSGTKLSLDAIRVPGSAFSFVLSARVYGWHLFIASRAVAKAPTVYPAFPKTRASLYGLPLLHETSAPPAAPVRLRRFWLVTSFSAKIWLTSILLLLPKPGQGPLCSGLFFLAIGLQAKISPWPTPLFLPFRKSYARLPARPQALHGGSLPLPIFSGPSPIQNFSQASFGFTIKRI